jgi:acyl-CoA thioesterase FadM
MHFTNYLRYFEACEEEFYRSVSMTFNDIQRKYGITLPRVATHCSYKTACRFDDTFDVIMQLREASETITWDFQASRQPERRLAAEGYMHRRKPGMEGRESTDGTGQNGSRERTVSPTIVVNMR